MPKGKINQYKCDNCAGVITTIDRDEGTTAMVVYCLISPLCDGRMVSSMYQVDQDLTPDHEWYKPAKLPKDPGKRDHVKRGGLMIQPIDQPHKGEVLEVFIVDHRYYDPEEAAPRITQIAYTDSIVKAKVLAERHRGGAIPWVAAYDTIQSQIGGFHEYIIRAEMMNQFTDAGHRM